MLVERLPWAVDAEAAFAALYARSRYAFWLDSGPGAGSDDRTRWSYLGDGSGPDARLVRADVRAGTVTVGRPGERGVVRSTGFFDHLGATTVAADPSGLPSAGPVPFGLGHVGYLGYELKAETGGVAAHRSRWPDAALLETDRLLAVDHRDGGTYLLARDVPGAGDWVRDTTARLRRLRPLDPPPPPGPAPALAFRHGRDAYLRKVAACREAIAAGETYEICLTNEITADAGGLDPFTAYRRLRRGSPAPYGGHLRFGDLAVLSASPERFLAVGADGLVESRPIKGTRPRGATPDEDAALRAELRHSEKDRAENVMIVDLVRNDLARVAVPGSVEVAGLFEVESYATVHQLVSTVRAKLAAGRTAVDVVRAAFPGGSMTGAPKIRTMELLDGLEAGPRGVYAGGLGWFAASGAVDLAMVIRTAVLAGGRLAYGTGGAVVIDSDPVGEYEETLVKARPLLRMLAASPETLASE